MTANPLREYARHLSRAVGQGELAAMPDADLLVRFVESRDDAAFEALVRRHGPMVLGVCRRIIGDAHEAEDAFQSAFLVLARKADSVRPAELVGHWLHGVACRVAMKARGRLARTAKQGQLPEPAVPDGEITSDWRPLIDQALNRLPERYRVPVLLCGVEGKTKREAAELIGVPEGTVSSRLARGREMLQRRLSRLGACVAVAELFPDTAAAIPPKLVRRTVTASLADASAGSAWVKVAALFGALAAGVASLAAFQRSPAVPPEVPRRGPVTWNIQGISADAIVTLSQDGKVLDTSPRRRDPGEVSPDGKRVVYREGSRGELWVSDIDGGNARQLTGLGAPANETGQAQGSNIHALWSADGKRIIFASDRTGKWQIHSMKSDGGDPRQVSREPTGAWHPRVSAEGRLAYLAWRERKGKALFVDLVIVDIDPSDADRVTVLEENRTTQDLTWSPDGKAIAFADHTELTVHDFETGKRQRFPYAEIDKKLYAHGAYQLSWRPDGKVIACRVHFLGGRMAAPDGSVGRIAGDDELFLIPLEGEVKRFKLEDRFTEIRWVAE